MSLRRTLAISRRIAEFFRRDHRTLGLVFIAPIVIMALLGWVIRDQGPSATDLAVVNTAGDIGAFAQGSIVEAARNSGKVHLIIETATEGDARQRLIDGEIDVAII